MDEIWERAVETALDGQTDVDLVRTLTLDGAVKCVHGRLPPPPLFEKFRNLQHLSMANIGASSLEQFPRLPNLQKLILSDNRIAGGLEFLVGAGLESLRDLDLSNNRISDINDLRPLAQLRLVSLDLYECPVTRVKDYRSRVFGLIRSLKYLDKMDAEENERPESDDEEEEEEDEEDDPGSGEIDGEDRSVRLNNGQHPEEGVVEVDEDEESDADEEETETSRGVNGISHGGSSHSHSNGFRVEPVVEEEEDDEIEEEDDSVEEVFEEDEGEDDDVVVVHEIDDDSDDDDDDDEDDDVDEDDDDVDEEEEEVDNEERDSLEPDSSRRLTSTEGEIDGHEQGEDVADEDDDGETGEEEQAVEEDAEFEDEEEAEDEEEDDYGSGYLVQPVGRVEIDAGASDAGEEDEDPEMDEDVEDEEEDDQDGEVQELPPSSSTSNKRKRDVVGDDSANRDDIIDDDDGSDDGSDDDGDEDEDDDNVERYRKSPKQ
ncbi:hypothetical protein ACP275_12G037300 [Erythranthe tilingii]